MDENALDAAAIAVRDVFINSGASPYRMAEAAITAYLEASGEARDAARYRHVRANPAMLLHLSNRDFDAAIDAARNG